MRKIGDLNKVLFETFSKFLQFLSNPQEAPSHLFIEEELVSKLSSTGKILNQKDLSKLVNSTFQLEILEILNVLGHPGHRGTFQKYVEASVVKRNEYSQGLVVYETKSEKVDPSLYKMMPFHIFDKMGLVRIALRVTHPKIFQFRFKKQNPAKSETQEQEIGKEVAPYERGLQQSLLILENWMIKPEEELIITSETDEELLTRLCLGDWVITDFNGIMNGNSLYPNSNDGQN